MNPNNLRLAPFSTRLGSSLLGILLRSITFQIGFLIWSFFLWSKGETPNKKIVGIKVVSSETLQPLSFKHLALRQLGFPFAYLGAYLAILGLALLNLLSEFILSLLVIAIFLLWLVDRLWIFRGNYKQRLTDVWCKTYVVTSSQIENSTTVELNRLNPEVKTKRNSLQIWVGAGLVFSILFTVGLFNLKKNEIPFLNGCHQLRNELAQQDEVGYKLWEEYQREVSAIALTPFNRKYLANGNAARRVVQVLRSDLIGFELMKKKPHCLNNFADIDDKVIDANAVINYLEGRQTLDGRYWSSFSNWNTNYYSGYELFEKSLK